MTASIRIAFAKFYDLEPAYLKYYSLLTDKERDRTDNFQSRIASTRFVLSRGKLKLLLSEFIGIELSSIHIKQENRNKPYLEGNEFCDIDFNISHTKDIVSIAMAKGTKLGIDSEAVEYNPYITPVSQQFFSHAEQKLVALGLRNGCCHPFYRLWTRREAFLKGIGHGIAWLEDWKETSFDGDHVMSPHSINRWELIDIDIAPNYCCALSFIGDKKHTNIEEIKYCKE